MHFVIFVNFGVKTITVSSVLPKDSGPMVHLSYFSLFNLSYPHLWYLSPSSHRLQTGLARPITAGL